MDARQAAIVHDAMDWNWKVLINLLVALLFLAAAWYLLRQESFFAVGKRDPGMGRLFDGASLRWLAAAMSCGAAFALTWAWRLARHMTGGLSDNVPGAMLLLLAVACLVLAFRAGRQIPTPGKQVEPATSLHAPAAAPETKP